MPFQIHKHVEAYHFPQDLAYSQDRCLAEGVAVGDVAVIDVSLCIGCGLCASACPMGAIDLIRKSDSVQPPAGTKELALKVAEERGRVDAFLANLT
jgi:Fe-S-cluster-containing hydrogenase component 2